ncbi:MAG: hypothetical protein J0I75_22340 [Hyphomicrobium sp.]|nr:hypothetical protein [Hyphomicrobium sp.]
MLAHAEDFLAKASNDDDCLVRIERSNARWSTMLGLTAAGATILALFGGMFLVTTQAISEPETVSLALAKPMATLQIVAGLLLLSALLLVPVRRLLADLGREGFVEIDGNIVRVAEKGLFSSRTFREPLDQYEGVAHRIRTTVSGLHHELVLVHPDARRDVVIALDRLEPAVSPAPMIARIGLPEITASEAARRR